MIHNLKSYQRYREETGNEYIEVSSRDFMNYCEKNGVRPMIFIMKNGYGYSLMGSDIQKFGFRYWFEAQDQLVKEVFEYLEEDRFDYIYDSINVINSFPEEHDLQLYNNMITSAGEKIRDLLDMVINKKQEDSDQTIEDAVFLLMYCKRILDNRK